MSYYSYYYNDMAKVIDELDKMNEVLEHLENANQIDGLRDSVHSIKYLLSNLSIERVHLLT